MTAKSRLSRSVLPSALLGTLLSFFTIVPTALAATGKPAEPVPEHNYRAGSAPVTLSNGSGEGSLSVTVDGYGSFGSSTPAGDAFYDPVGPLGRAGTVYESGLFFSPLGNFLTTDSFGATLPPVVFDVATTTLAVSRFSVAGFDFTLVQTLSEISPAGSRLVQRYTLTNHTGASQTLRLVRHVDGDLYFVGGLGNDFGGATSGGRTLFEFDAGDNPAAPTSFVGITSSGGNGDAFTVQPFRFSDDIVTGGGIPAVFDGQVAGDTNGDLITDSGYDVTLSLGDTLSLAAGASTTYISTTLFGAASTGSLAVETVDPACRTENLCDGDFLVQTGPESAWLDSRADRLAQASVLRTGITTDGVTILLLRSRSDEAVTFSLTTLDDQPAGPEWGELFTRNGTPAGNSVTVLPEPAGGESMAFAVYRAPRDFPLPSAALSTGVRIEAQSASANGTTQLLLTPPPVILVHGLWSSAATWTSEDAQGDPTSLVTYLSERGFRTDTADYAGSAASSFDPTARSLPVEALRGRNLLILRELRNQGFAVTQVDILGHSMGALVARSRMSYALSPYRTRANRFQGFFRKVLSLGSPHQGSEMANALIANRCATFFGYRLESALAKAGKPLGEAVFQLQTGSAALGRLGASKAASFALTGEAPAESDTEDWLNILLARFDVETTVDEILGGDQEHDTIVSLTSQQGGLDAAFIHATAGLVHAPISLSGDDTGETTSADVWQKVEELLLTPAASFGRFPAYTPSGPNAQSAACPTQGVSSTAGGGVSVSLTPAPGTVVAPGEPVRVSFQIAGGQPVDGALLNLGNQGTVVPGSGSFVATLRAPRVAGRVDLFALTGGNGEYAAESYVVVALPEPPSSLASSTPELELFRVGDGFPLTITATQPDGTQVDVTSGAAGTSYTTLSGTSSVVAVSADGLIEARGAGQETVLISNGGASAAVVVDVILTNLPPVFSPVSRVRVAPGQILRVPIEVKDPEGEALTATGLVLPSFATFQPKLHGGTLTLRPTAVDAGTWSIRLGATDTGNPPMGEVLTLEVLVGSVGRQ